MLVPACQETPAATTWIVPSRLRANWASGPGRPERPFCTTELKVVGDCLAASWWAMTDRTPRKLPCPRVRQPGRSTTGQPMRLAIAARAVRYPVDLLLATVVVAPFEAFTAGL